MSEANKAILKEALTATVGFLGALIGAIFGA